MAANIIITVGRLKGERIKRIQAQLCHLRRCRAAFAAPSCIERSGPLWQARHSAQLLWQARSLIINSHLRAGEWK